MRFFKRCSNANCLFNYLKFFHQVKNRPYFLLPKQFIFLAFLAYFKDFLLIVFAEAFQFLGSVLSMKIHDVYILKSRYGFVTFFGCGGKRLPYTTEP